VVAQPKFEMYVGSGGKYYWRLKAPNGEIIATGEGYSSKAACKKGIESVKNNSPKAEIFEIIMGK